MSSKEDKVSLNGTAMPEHCYSEGKLNVEVLVTGGCVRHDGKAPGPGEKKPGKAPWKATGWNFGFFLLGLASNYSTL